MEIVRTKLHETFYLGVLRSCWSLLGNNNSFVYHLHLKNWKSFLRKENVHCPHQSFHIVSWWSIGQTDHFKIWKGGVGLISLVSCVQLFIVPGWSSGQTDHSNFRRLCFWFH